jgi:hypothetical protein
MFSQQLSFSFFYFFTLEDEIDPKIWLVLVWLATLDVLNCINHQEETSPIISAKLSSEDPSRFAMSF